MPKMKKKNTVVKVDIISDMPASQLQAPYFQWLFENGNNYGMTSCPSGKKTEIADLYEGLILLGHEKEIKYMLIRDEV